VFKGAWLSSGEWQRLFAQRFASNPYAADFLLEDAAAGWGRLDVVQYLVSKGAEINPLDKYGDSPLDVAMSQGRKETAEFLKHQGGERIRGTDADRQKVNEADVRELRELIERNHNHR
jgi:hypothetical protein